MVAGVGRAHQDEQGDDCRERRRHHAPRSHRSRLPRSAIPVRATRATLAITKNARSPVSIPPPAKDRKRSLTEKRVTTALATIESVPMWTNHKTSPAKSDAATATGAELVSDD